MYRHVLCHVLCRVLRRVLPVRKDQGQQCADLDPDDPCLVWCKHNMEYAFRGLGFNDNNVCMLH